jgi:hypothetical protein
MTTLIAKPIIKDQYWVVTDGSKKIGNVVATGSGYDLKINGNDLHFQSTNDIVEKTQIEFLTLNTNKNKNVTAFNQYPTTSRVYNSMLDIKRKLHLYTKTAKSKCYYAAGYFAINQNDGFEVIFCPKYIFIQRYPYFGPYKTKEEAENMINNL